MGADYMLIRVPSGRSFDEVRKTEKFGGLSFASADEVERLLLENPDFEREPDAAVQAELASMKLPPGMGPTRWISYNAVFPYLSFTLQDDPVTGIGTDHAHPRDFDVVMRALHAFGPFGIIDFQTGDLLDPTDLPEWCREPPDRTPADEFGSDWRREPSQNDESWRPDEPWRPDKSR